MTAFILNAWAFELKTTIVINAKPEEVWKTFTKFEDYPNWNPFITSLKGNVVVGNKIVVHLEVANTKTMVFKPKVLKYDCNQSFQWKGRLLMPGLFDGQHSFQLIDNGDGTTTFIQSEKFKGILVPFLKKQLNTNTRQGFIDMNEALKAKIEVR